MKRRPIRIFVSYSHVDRDWFKELQPLLVFDSRPTRLAYAWHDNELKAGDRWDDDIRKELAEMDVFVCLLSYYFRASRYISDVEKPAALEREKQRKTVIVPLFLTPMDERDYEEFKPFSPLPAYKKSWLCYKTDGDLRLAHKPIRTGLLDVIEKINAAPATK
jgi:TIR domain